MKCFCVSFANLHFCQDKYEVTDAELKEIEASYDRISHKNIFNLNVIQERLHLQLSLICAVISHEHTMSSDDLSQWKSAEYSWKRVQRLLKVYNFSDYESTHTIMKISDFHVIAALTCDSIHSHFSIHSSFQSVIITLVDLESQYWFLRMNHWLIHILHCLHSSISALNQTWLNKRWGQKIFKASVAMSRISSLSTQDSKCKWGDKSENVTVSSQKVHLKHTIDTSVCCMTVSLSKDEIQSLSIFAGLLNEQIRWSLNLIISTDNTD